MSIRNERRRRLISDDQPADSADESAVRIARPSPDDGGSATLSYALPNGRRRSRALDSLLPARLVTIGLITVAGLILVGLLVMGHIWADLWSERLTASEMTLFDLGSERNLGHWSASTLLGGAAVVALIVFSLRRHRMDDYHGRYRVWLWVVLGCLFASLCETSSVGNVAQGLCRRAGDACGVDGELVWPITFGILLAAMGIRLLIEVWRSRASACMLTVAGLCMLAAWLVDFGCFSAADDVHNAAISGGGWLAGYVLLASTMLLYTRHVIREIDGLVALPVRKKKLRKVATEKNDKSLRVDPPQKPSPKLRTDLEPTRISASQPSRASQDDEDDDADARGSHVSMHSARGGLSRTERRRLRREAARKAS